jgi:hypothetical protein
MRDLAAAYLAAASKEGRNPSAEEIGEIASRYDFRAV